MGTRWMAVVAVVMLFGGCAGTQEQEFRALCEHLCERENRNCRASDPVDCQEYCDAVECVVDRTGCQGEWEEHFACVEHETDVCSDSCGDTSAALVACVAEHDIASCWAP